MKKIYWKIFIWFWVATSLSILITALISSQVTRQSSNDADSNAFISSISAAAIIMVDQGNQAQFMLWCHYLQEHYGITLLLLPLHQAAGSGEPPIIFQPIVRHIRHGQPSKESFIRPPFMVSQPLIAADGFPYRLIAKLPEEMFQKYKFNRGNIASRFLVAFLISGIICYLLSLYLARPIRVLQRAARRLGRGDFSTRVGVTLAKRHDEIGELAAEFDDMAERIQTLVTSRQRLLQDISHELRSPLARLSVALELAKDKSPQAEKEWQRINLEAEKLNMLIGQILSLASLNKQIDTIAFTSIDLVSMIQSIIDDANYEAQHLPSTIRLTAPAHCFIHANGALLRSAIENIVRNALKYTEKDQPIAITIIDDEKTSILIEDTGPGIPEEKLPLVFDPFYRADDSRTQSTGGFGLGMTIAKKAIELHHGKIRAYNLQPHGLGVEIVL